MNLKNTRNRMCACLSMALAFGSIAVASSSDASVVDDSILFIGNSYVYQSVGHDGTNVDRFFNDTAVSPFEALVAAASNNNTVGVGSTLNNNGSQNLSVGGSSLAQHANNSGSANSSPLGQNNFEVLDPASPTGQVWDVVLLQDFSTRPGRTIAGESNYNNSEFFEFYVDGITAISNELQANGQTSAKIVLYETWAREEGVVPTNQFANRQEMFDLTSQGYSQARDLLTTDTSEIAVPSGDIQPSLFGLDVPNEVVIAPVGTAIENLLVDVQTSAVYAQLVADGKASADINDILFDNSTPGGAQDVSSHLALAGEFLAASVLFETIYGLSVLELIENGSLTQADLLSVWSQNDSPQVASGEQTLDIDLARYLAGISLATTNVPEPTSLALLLAGGVLLTSRRRRG